MTMAASIEDIAANLREVSAGFAARRSERLERRALDRADFTALAEAGFLATGVPAARGGLWQDMRRSTRPISDLVRIIAHGDPSVALVSTMHSAVLFFWMRADEPPAGEAKAWQAQCDALFESAEAGHWWGTMASEPSSGGDLLASRTAAVPDGNGGYRLTGDKHFASGSGITGYMVTVARPDGEDLPDLFYMDLRDTPWDGSTGLRLVREWDGIGMAATQSHAFRIENFPARRYARPGAALSMAPASAAFTACTFAAVIVGIMDTARAAARERLTPKAENMKPYEKVEWATAVNECWLIEQAFEGMLRAVESDLDPGPATARGKAAIAGLAESAMTRIARVIGGSSLSRGAPFGQWGQDVRALGFLRPPWALAYDALFDHAWND